MRNYSRSLVVPALVGAIGGVLSTLAAPVAAHAQTSALDHRLLPLLGCWTPQTDPTLQRLPTASQRLCVVPGGTATTVRFMSFVGDSVADDLLMDAGGRRSAVTQGDCTGYRTTRFAEGDGARLFTEESLDCRAGAPARATEVLDFASAVELVQVRGWRQREAGDARLVRWFAEENPAAMPELVRGVLAGRWREVRAARERQVTTVGLEAVVEASRVLDEPVVRAWVYARGSGQRVRLDARSLRRLRDEGVPGTVTDVLVALANPEVFRFASQATVAMTPRDARGGGGMSGMAGQRAAMLAMANACWTGFGLCGVDPWLGWGGFNGMALDPFGFGGFGWVGGPGAFGWGWNGVGRFSPWGWNGFSPWGWGGGFAPWGGGTIGFVPGGGYGGPVPVYTGPRDNGGYADRSRGYTRGTPGGGGGGAMPVPSASGRGGSSGSSGGGGGGGGSSGGSSGGSGGGSSGGGRVAVPKPPTT